MYIHVYQYPGLEFLPIRERHKIIQAAANKYDRWWAARSVFQTLKYIFIPIVFMGTIIFLAEDGLIDKAEAIKAINSNILFSNEFIIAYYLISALTIYLRCVNSSGFEQIVKMYLEVERINASKVTNKYESLTIYELETLSRAESEKKRKNKKWSSSWIFIYFLVVVATTIYFRSNFASKIAPPTPLIYISALKQNIDNRCDIEFSMSNNSTRTVDEIRAIVTLHSISENTISTESVGFKFIDAGKSGSPVKLFITQEVCQVTEIIKLRSISECRIEGANIMDCEKYIKLTAQNENSLQIK